MARLQGFSKDIKPSIRSAHVRDGKNSDLDRLSSVTDQGFHQKDTETSGRQSIIGLGETGDNIETNRLSINEAVCDMSSTKELPLWREIIFVGAVCTAQIMTQVALSSNLVLLHIIGDSFGVTNPNVLSWFAAGYSLTVGTFIFLAGRFGDVFGYKRVLLIGFVWFTLWSFISGLSVWSNSVLFIFARVLTGIGPAICLPNSLAILGATYSPGARKSMVFAIFAACSPGGSAIGSLIASLWAMIWWPWAFWALSVGLLVTTCLGAIVIPSPPPKIRKNRDSWKELVDELDLLGGLLGVAALVLFNFSWNQAPIVGWQSPYVIVTLILSIIFMVAFFYVEIAVAKEPLIPFEALNMDTAYVMACVGLGWSSFGCWIFYTWQFFQIIRHKSPLVSSAYMLPVIFSGGFASILAGYLLNRIRPAWVMVMAEVAFLTGLILMGTAPVDQSYWIQSFLAMIITPFGMDMSFPAGTLILSNKVSKQQQGVAASLVNTIVNYSVSLGLGFAGTVEVHVNHGGKNLPDILLGYRSAYWLGIGLASLGLCVSVVYVVKTYQSTDKDQTINITHDVQGDVKRFGSTSSEETE